MKYNIPVGTTFNYWTVIEAPYRVSTYKYIAKCVCRCGTIREVNIYHLIQGTSYSCNCVKRTQTPVGMEIHSPEIYIWQSMKARCENPKDKAYLNYGGRGISVCDRWKESFANFIEDMGRKPSKGHSLERKDNELGYSPDNCKWATRLEQNNNTRQNSVGEYEGQAYTVAEFARKFELKASVVAHHKRKGKSYAETLQFLRNKKERNM